MSDDYKQKRCRHGWVDESQCDACKTERELAAANARAEEAERKQAIDQRQCDDMTSEAGKMATELMAMTTRADELQAELNTSREQWRTMACPECAMVASLKAERDVLVEKVKRADNILLEVWGAYNRIGDALKDAPPKAEAPR